MEEMRSKKSKLSSRAKIIDFEIFKYLIDKKFLEPFSIIIEAPILAGLFKDYEWTENFLSIAYYSNTVICCRVSPSQKRQVVQKIKNFDSEAVTLAIGDGGNDVSMIMEANIGIGIYGEEGMSAAQSSDFSIGEFKMLKRLLFVHGRTYLYCISKMILYFFYKNFVFSLIQFYFSFLCLGSGQTFVDDWYITFYNLIFTALPLGISALTDSDIDLNNSKKAKQNLPLLYKENRDNYKIFSLGRFIITLIKGIFISFFIFISCCIKQILTLQGHFANIWFLSIKTIICVLFVVSANLLINNYFIVIYLPLSIFITTYLIFFIFLILNHYGLLFKFNSKATIFPSLTSPILYLTLFLVSCFSIVIDYSFKLFELFFSNSLSSKIILNESLKGKRKSSIRIFNIGTRSYSHNRIKIRKNSAYPLKSKNNYMTKYTLSNKNVLIKNNGQTNLISKFNNSSLDNQYKNIN
jgi:magnesium-transporting ATPase (P-type)